jgi:hypothetical protein
VGKDAEEVAVSDGLWIWIGGVGGMVGWSDAGLLRDAGVPDPRGFGLHIDLGQYR